MRAAFTLTWHDPDDAENVAQVLIEAGTRGAQIIDRGFYEDGRSLNEQVDKWRAAQRQTGDDAMSDPFTMDMRLCGDTGYVDDSPVEDGNTLDKTYLERHNRLRNMSREARGDKPVTTTERFVCTGDAHFVGEHIRCTSPAHVVRIGAVGMVGEYMPDTVVINDETFRRVPPQPKLDSTRRHIAEQAQAKVRKDFGG